MENSFFGKAIKNIWQKIESLRRLEIRAFGWELEIIFFEMNQASLEAELNKLYDWINNYEPQFYFFKYDFSEDFCFIAEN
jgi:hypothetical protein